MELTGLIGLNKEEVNKRKKEGKINKSKSLNNESHLKIIFNSFFNFYNLILYILALVFLFVEIFNEEGIKYIPVTKYGFLFIILLNASFSIFTYEKSRKELKKLDLLKNDFVYVIRENSLTKIKSNEIVIDDLIYLNESDSNYSFIDGIIIKGNGYFNESFLTGESKLVYRNIGEEILSGASLVKGSVVLKVIRVGNETYLKKLENKVRSIKKEKSKLNKDINKIILSMVILLPIAILFIFLSTLIFNLEFDLSLLVDISTVVVGMIPIGLVLLSGVTLSNSIIKLAKDKIVVKELYAIENLARINMIAFDKTGTLTSDKITLENEVFFLEENKREYYNKLLSLYLSLMNDNKTSLALKDRFNYLDLDSFKKENNLTISEINLFESSKKYSSLKINNDYFYLGAKDILLKGDKYKEINYKIQEYENKGKRCLVFLKNEEAIYLFILENALRDNVSSILNYFKELNINIKVITGDNLVTTLEVLNKLNFDKNRAISLENIDINKLDYLSVENDVFARSTPEKKERIIEALENKYSYKVAYCGDGINDITSLRRAFSSISLKSAVSSAQSISDFVLLDDNFSKIPLIINEGRRVINNIERTCILFVSKNIVLFLFSLFSLFSKYGFSLNIESIYIYEFVIVALCGFLLSIEKNTYKKINENMIKDVLKKGILAGIYLSFGGLVFSLLSFTNLIQNTSICSSLLISLCGPVVLFFISYPFSKYSFKVFILGCFLTIFLLILAPDIFLNKEYLLSASSISGQIDLIIKDLFNLEIYNKITNIEYIILFSVYFISSFIFIYLTKFIKKKDK